MSWAGVGLLAALCAALVSLLLSLGSQRTLTRLLARASIWMLVLVLPISVLEAALGSGSDAARGTAGLARGLSQALSLGALGLPAAGIAMLALRRANRAARAGR